MIQGDLEFGQNSSEFTKVDSTEVGYIRITIFNNKASFKDTSGHTGWFKNYVDKKKGVIYVTQQFQSNTSDNDISGNALF